ncbi:histidine kinase [Acidovorax sp. JMULE5]|uniref:sensor histidine kinase n=1 Tax=Acidovorax sp. JMULE5 TaxID=2518343 RepID=UPI0015A213E5|nr:ATP-binding protein [Acidovorax sp. JMULE5]QLA79682.1 histidine kinase [Acidovorax sp. JMULE5]
MRLLMWLAALALWLPGGVLADACAPRIVSVQAAPALDGARPLTGWVNVTLPDTWTTRWRAHGDSGWYRIDWERGCENGEPVALGIDGISVAGEVYSNGDLLWRDAFLVEPLSRSWNVPRWWVLPESGLQPEMNTVWVRAVGPVALGPGLRGVRLGDPSTVAAQHYRTQWRQRTLYLINAVLCGMAGTLFLVVWALRHKTPAGAAYGWFGLMALTWLLYLTTYLAYTQWPWPDAITRSRFSMVAMVGYVLSACFFTLRFGGQRLPRVEQGLWALAAVGAGTAVLVPDNIAGPWFGRVWQGSMWVFIANCLQFQWHAWRPQTEGRKPLHMLLALCWLAVTALTVTTLIPGVDRWNVARNWAAFSGLLVISLVMLLLGAQLMQRVRSVERFNRALTKGVTEARAELAQALAREHAHALERTRLQERMQLAHDLHDGLGGSLMRSMALVEQAPQPLPNERAYSQRLCRSRVRAACEPEWLPQPLPNERVLSLLKVLRDDLRQVIDQGSSAGAQVPDTPVQWAAPLRHRFTGIFDEMEVASHWDMPLQWQGRPSALQCLSLTRLVEEALSNTIKHSRARHVHVQCTQPQRDVLCLRIEDDGVGFDVQAVQNAGVSVGMRSMAARAERMGGTLEVTSGAAGTVVSLVLRLKK